MNTENLSLNPALTQLVEPLHDVGLSVDISSESSMSTSNAHHLFCFETNTIAVDVVTTPQVAAHPGRERQDIRTALSRREDVPSTDGGDLRDVQLLIPRVGALATAVTQSNKAISVLVETTTSLVVCTAEGVVSNTEDITQLKREHEETKAILRSLSHRIDRLQRRDDDYNWE